MDIIYYYLQYIKYNHDYIATPAFDVIKFLDKINKYIYIITIGTDLLYLSICVIYYYYCGRVINTLIPSVFLDIKT